jgi:hypothetical protein
MFLDAPVERHVPVDRDRSRFGRRTFSATLGLVGPTAWWIPGPGMRECKSDYSSETCKAYPDHVGECASGAHSDHRGESVYLIEAAFVIDTSGPPC